MSIFSRLRTEAEEHVDLNKEYLISDEICG